MSISCIIPAYNEQAGIANVLEAVLGASSPIDEIIVVDDGSADATPDIVRRYAGVRLLISQTNHGKCDAVVRGIRESTGDILLLLDADLIGIQAADVDALLKPALTGIAEIVISMRGNTPGLMKRAGIDFMSGERVFPRSLVADSLDELADLRFGLEVYLNGLIVRRGHRVASVLLGNVRNHMKWEKKTILRGLFEEARMWRDILQVVSVRELITQTGALRRVLVAYP